MPKSSCKAEKENGPQLLTHSFLFCSENGSPQLTSSHLHSG